MTPKTRFSRLAWFVCLALCCGLVSCDSGAQQPSAAGATTLTIGMMPKLIGIDFFNACERGAKEAAEELGVKLIFDGPVTDDVTKQAEMADTWITRRLDVIAVAPNDPSAIAPTLKKAMESGIKVLTWDSDSLEDARHFYVNQARFKDIGDANVDVMAKQLGGKGKTALITGTLTSSNQNTWIEWMRKRIQEKYPELEIITVEPALENQQKAFQVAQDLMKAYPDLDGIFGLTSVALPAAAEAVRQAGKSGKIAVTGLSTPNLMRQYVKDGTVKEFVLFSPVDLGYLTVHVAKAVKEAGEVPNPFPAGRLGKLDVENRAVILGMPTIFNKDNIDNYNF